MKFLNLIRAKLFRIQQAVLYKMIKTRIIGADTSKLELDTTKPIIYAMVHPSHSERMVIDREATQIGLPSPFEQPIKGLLNGQAFLSIYRRPSIPFRSGNKPYEAKQLASQINWMLEEDERDIQVLPIRVFWGREPDKEQSFWRIWLQTIGSFGGRLLTFFAILVNGRNTFVHFSEPLSLRELAAGDESVPDISRKLLLLLRAHNKQVETSVLGPELSHRKTLVHQLQNRPFVLQAIKEEAETSGKSLKEVKAKALAYSDELASNISYSNVRMLDVVLTWVWNKIYNGTQIFNLDQTKEVSKDHTIIYVPCHRSHIDYLLLSYVLYHNGLQIPHIAAGINLNMPVLGPVLRRGGAFFMRRTFRDNKLYAAVFDEYLHSIFTHGYSSEYFVEGGRSRTGRTLSPKGGMLAMTLRSYLRDSNKPIALVPVYTGYEKVLEEGSYLGELRGKTKKKESFTGVLSSLKSLRNLYGKVRVTFGSPIFLTDFLNQHQEGWKTQDYSQNDYKPDWAPATVNLLAREVVTGINHATSVNPINLLAIAILSTPRQAMTEQQLIRRMETYNRLINKVPYSPLMETPEGEGKDWVAHAEEMKSVTRVEHTLGDLINTNEKQAVTLTYYRNNVLHIFALPALIACLIVGQRRYSKQEIIEDCEILYVFLQAELFLHWNKQELDDQVELWLATLVDEGLILLKDDQYSVMPDDTDALNLLTGLSEHLIQTLQRYFLALARLKTQGSGEVTAAELEEQSTLLAQRVNLLFGINSPEFFDKALFRALIKQLIAAEFVRVSEEEKLEFGEDVNELVEVLEKILDSSLQKNILDSL